MQPNNLLNMDYLIPLLLLSMFLGAIFGLITVLLSMNPMDSKSEAEWSKELRKAFLWNWPVGLLFVNAINLTMLILYNNGNS